MVIPVVLVLLCSVLTPALGCDWLSRYHHYSNITLTHLRLMGNQGTDEEMQFPEKLYKHMGQREVNSQVVFIRDSLDQIAELYRHSDLSSASWLANHTNGFRTSLDRLIAGLNTCVPTDHKHNHKQNHKLKIYYRRLRSRVLDCTPALWELMRTETKLHLERLDMMVNNIVNPRSTAAAATTTSRRRSAAAATRRRH